MWIAENLKVTHYRNNVAIHQLVADNHWAGNSDSAYCEYDNSSALKDTFGLLYSWYAASDSNLAPYGWRAATATDWQLLIDTLGGSAAAGGKLKAAGTSRWTSPNIDATNETGFSCLPGGHRGDGNGICIDLGFSALFWTSTSDGLNGRSFSLFYDLASILGNPTAPGNGGSIRCVRN